jgi:hypothetical protein
MQSSNACWNSIRCGSVANRPCHDRPGGSLLWTTGTIRRRRVRPNQPGCRGCVRFARRRIDQLPQQVPHHYCQRGVTPWATSCRNPRAPYGQQTSNDRPMVGADAEGVSDSGRCKVWEPRSFQQQQFADSSIHARDCSLVPSALLRVGKHRATFSFQRKTRSSVCSAGGHACGKARNATDDAPAACFSTSRRRSQQTARRCTELLRSHLAVTNS